jgi:hypothetical protein
MFRANFLAGISAGNRDTIDGAAADPEGAAQSP